MHNSKIMILLSQLGLTEYESRTLTTLFDLYEADAPDISRNAEIPKTRVYDVLEKLKEKGLVLEVYGRPKKYKVIDPEDIFKNLLDKKQKEFKDLDKQVKDILVKENWKNHVVAQEKLLQVRNLKDYNKLLSQEFESAKNQINGFTHLDSRFDAFDDVKEKSNLDVKLITKPNVKEFEIPKNFQIKEKDHSMDAYVIDNNKIIMSLNDLSTPKEVYHLTVLKNNPSLTKAITTHFDQYWA
jgi:HTH-type transcriptional regulator, sugar sensing transcriptional regulator